MNHRHQDCLATIPQLDGEYEKNCRDVYQCLWLGKMLMPHKNSGGSVRNYSLVVNPRDTEAEPPPRTASAPLPALQLPSPSAGDDDLKRAMMSALSPRSPRVHTPRPLQSVTVASHLEAAFAPEQCMPASPRVKPADTLFLGVAEPTPSPRTAELKSAMPARSNSSPPERMPRFDQLYLTPEQPSVRLARESVLVEMSLVKKDLGVPRPDSPLIPSLPPGESDQHDALLISPQTRNSVRFRELEKLRLDAGRCPTYRATIAHPAARKETKAFG